MRKILSTIMAFMMVSAFAGAVWAANNVDVTVTSEPIRAGATCDKAGGFVLTFDEGTVLAEGDVITIDLPLNVSLCRDIDIEISPGGSGAFWESGTETPNAGADTSPVLESSDGVVTVPAGGAGVYFRLAGTTGSQRLTLYVLGDGDPATVNELDVRDTTADADTLKIYFLDQQTNNEFSVDGIYIDDDNDGTYDVAATVADNTYCINVSQYSGEYVKVGMDSKDDKFTFVPSDPQVAHIFAPISISLYDCKGKNLDRIPVGNRITQGNDSCPSFDNEEPDDFCSNAHSNDLIIRASSPFDQVDYKVRLEILVNGQSGDNGVYFLDEDIGYVKGADSGDVCGQDPTATLAANYYDAAGNDITANVPATNNDSCDVPTNPSERAVVAELAASTQFNFDGANDRYLKIDIPEMRYDLDEINEGDVVSIKVTLLKDPCGTVFEDVLEIAPFGCVQAGTSYYMLYPYYTPMNDGADAYWDGFVITNLSSNDGTATITVYEQDGDVGQMTVNVAGMSMYVNLLSQMVANMTQIGGTGTLGDSRCYITVQTDFNTDGFAMMGDPASGEAMGYLPRQTTP